jgi:hypothetical protein
MAPRRKSRLTNVAYRIIYAIYISVRISAALGFVVAVLDFVKVGFLMGGTIMRTNLWCALAVSVEGPGLRCMIGTLD